jgi:hypothetical protein
VAGRVDEDWIVYDPYAVKSIDECAPECGWPQRCTASRIAMIRRPARTLAIALLLSFGTGCSDSEGPPEDDYALQTKARKGVHDEAGEAPAGAKALGDGPDGGATPGGPDAASAPQGTADVKVDGAALKVTGVKLWSPDAEGTAHVFLNIEGTGAPAKTDIIITFKKAVAGCIAPPKANSQSLALRLPAPSYDQYVSADGAACGLTITKFPTKVGDLAEGSFKGTVTRINDTTQKKRAMEFTFAVPRTS